MCDSIVIDHRTTIETIGIFKQNTFCGNLIQLEIHRKIMLSNWNLLLKWNKKKVANKGWKKDNDRLKVLAYRVRVKLYFNYSKARRVNVSGTCPNSNFQRVLSFVCLCKLETLQSVRGKCVCRSPSANSILSTQSNLIDRVIMEISISSSFSFFSCGFFLFLVSVGPEVL